MNADRLGSYSSRSTVAGTSQVRRLKSTIRHFCLCPPATTAARWVSSPLRSPVAGTSQVRRLKSTIRYFCLCPPAMPRLVTWPLLLRPPVLRLPSVSALTGLPFHSDDLSTRIRPRCDEVVGLYDLSAICLASDTGGDVDGLAFGQRHDRLLHVRTRVGAALPAPGLALLGGGGGARGG